MARILLLDDDEVLLFTLEQTLIDAGHAVTAAVDGAVGAQLLKTKKFDLLLTDIYMPNRDGLETIISAHRDTPDMGVIGMSGALRLSSICLELAKRIGAHRTLTKPFSTEQMLEAVDSVLARNQTP